jgi:hypothetical protein
MEELIAKSAELQVHGVLSLPVANLPHPDIFQPEIA